MPTRRAFLQTMALAGFGVAAAPRLGARTGPSGSSLMCLAYTSFVVRLLQGRNIFDTTAEALSADDLASLCGEFSAGGMQLDMSQLESHAPEYLGALRGRLEKAGLWLELSVPSRYLESPEAYADMAAVAGALGVDRIRVALLSGRRYETFDTREAWQAFDSKWKAQVAAMKATIERHPIRVGIENHKDFTATELASWLETLDSPRIGACVDFGNNVALLEPPLETIRTLAPYAVTTHVKDMAVRRTEAGFDLSEVPLGQGLVPLAEAVDVLRQARPDVRFCLEMITRDPLKVPYRTDGYYTAVARPPDDQMVRFERDVLAHEWTKPLPTISDLDPKDQIAAEDDNVRRSVAFAKEQLRL
jgi:sugar phosphate isomerase/epimerase